MKKLEKYGLQLVVKNTEVVFDSNTSIDDRLEVESKTLKEMKVMIKIFNTFLILYDTRKIYGFIWNNNTKNT
jgi:hypothetical protein